MRGVSRSRGVRFSMGWYGMVGISLLWMGVLVRHLSLTPRAPPSMDHSEIFRAEALPLRTEMEWHGQRYPENDVWDFFGLKVPPTPAISRVQKGQVKADYNITAFDEDTTQYPNPAFKYPERNDRLFVTVSHRPRAYFFPQIATPEEVEYIKQMATPKLERSRVAITMDGKKHNQSETQEVRTSRSTWVELTGPLEQLNSRLVTVVGNSWHEPMNVLKYGHRQHYESHHDYFDPRYYGPQSSNRMATFFVYLDDTEEGGATTIPRANGGKVPANFGQAACQQGLQVFPRKGSGVLFYDMRPDKSLDPYSLHGSCDVVRGTKWGGPVWFRLATPQGTGTARE